MCLCVCERGMKKCSKQSMGGDFISGSDGKAMKPQLCAIEERLQLCADRCWVTQLCAEVD